MGREARCGVRLGDADPEGKALLEMDELRFRGDFRLVIPCRATTSLQAEGDVLVATAREAGLVDVKGCRFSETHTGHKSVPPKKQR